MRRDVFQAIADPTRREIIQLAGQQPLPLNTIAGHFDVSRPAISKHIRILTECGLLVIQQKGRERYCRTRPEKLNEVSAWIDECRHFWTLKLDALGRYAEDMQQRNSKKKSTSKK